MKVHYNILDLIQNDIRVNYCDSNSGGLFPQITFIYTTV